MNEILNLAQTISPLGVIALLVIVIYQLVNGKGLLDRIRGTQKSQNDGYQVGIDKLIGQNEILLENHFKHEVPDMVATLNRIDSKSDKTLEVLTEIKINTRK